LEIDFGFISFNFPLSLRFGRNLSNQKKKNQIYYVSHKQSFYSKHDCPNHTNKRASLLYQYFLDIF
jgi:hypothetical protein